MLLKGGASAEQADGRETLLHVAAREGFEDIVNTLCELANLNINTRNAGACVLSQIMNDINIYLGIALEQTMFNSTCSFISYALNFVLQKYWQIVFIKRI